MSLHANLLKEQYPLLSAVQHRLHCGRPSTWRGRVDVRRGGPRWLAALFRLQGVPAAGPGQFCAVYLQPDADGENQQRTLGAQRLNSRLEQEGALLRERVLGLTLYFALRVRGGRLLLRPAGARLLGVPLPRCLQPRAFGHESTRAGRLLFNVRLYLPGCGCVLAYRGWLQAAQGVLS